MPNISVVTPWSGITHELLADYDVAVRGAEVITIDNACDEHTAAGLVELSQRHPGKLIRNEKNLGFAAANNQGYTHATGDIIIFLNSDVAAPEGWLRAVAADVKDGALYGPALQYQLVGGRWLPYLEGWCIAATKATWEASKFCPSFKLPPRYQGAAVSVEWIGPWDSDDYPGPYWEDNDLCFRATQQGISLVQTQWQIQHKGGRTSGPLVRHAESFERNRATFSARVMAAFNSTAPVTPTQTQAIYQQHLATQSDIQHHLPLLYSLARCNVLELGTRSGVSTSALLAGVEVHGGKVWSVDLDDCSHLFAGHPLWTFRRGDSISQHTLKAVKQIVNPKWIDGEGFNLLLIDTLHTYTHVQKELQLWADTVLPGGTICIHDPETFPGVRRAIQEFCDTRGWPVTFVLPCNGMAVIEVPK